MAKKKRFDRMVCFMVTQKQFDALEAIAEKDLSDKSFVLRKLLEKEMERRGIK